MAADYFDLYGVHYLVTVDRLSGWLDITHAASGTPASGAAGLVACLRRVFADKGVPDTLSSDGGLEFTLHLTQEFLCAWKVKHRLSSAHFPQSNGQAEAAVKSAKRLMRSNVTKSGSLNMDSFVLAIMAHRKTPDPATGLSPAQILYGRQLRDAFRFASDSDRHSRAGMRPTWREAWELKERANRHQFYCQRQATNAHARDVKDLSVGNRVFVQNQHGGHGGADKLWDRSGQVVEKLGHGSYQIRGGRRFWTSLTADNRRSE